MFLVKLRHICAQVKIFVSVDDNKKNKLEDSLGDSGKGHLKSLIFLFSAAQTELSTSWRPSHLSARAKHNSISVQLEQ